MKDSRFMQCANPDCAKIVRRLRPEQVYCSRTCARRAEAKAKLPSKEEQLRAVMAAVEREIRRLLR